jgi:RNA-directed DNA polymerase
MGTWVRRDETGTEKGMEETYIEGVASHDGPGSCAGAREGDGEALAGVRAGRDMEPRNHIDRGADAVHVSGRQHDLERQREHQADPARSKTPRMCGLSVRENREVPWPPAVDGEAGRQGKAKATSRG